jgi:hypothetical protein
MMSDESIAPPVESRIQAFMTHVFSRYHKLSTRCGINTAPVETEDCVRCCKDSYFGGKSEYACDNFKRTYLIKYLAVQIEQIGWPIGVHLVRHFDEKSSISAISLGGGPGTEVIALMNNLAGNDNYQLTHVNIDAAISWKPVYDDIAQAFAKQVGNVKLKTRFVAYDLASTTYNGHRLYDIVFISWILSQIDDDDRSRILKASKNLVRPQGYILVTDRTQKALVENITSSLNEVCGASWIKKTNQLTHHCGVTFPEDIKNEFQVRINCNSTYWLLQRP